MDVDLVFKIAAIGILVAVLNILLSRAGRDEQALMTTIAGLVVVLVLVIQKISELFDLIKSLFFPVMEPVFQAIIIVVIAAAAAATVYKTVPGMSLLLSMAAALLALFLCIGLLEPLAAFFRDAIAVSKLSGVYTGPLLKCMTISILTMIGESLCKDAGQTAGACAVQLVGVAAALYAALPLMRTFLTMIGECL